jgi:hypothetical protein
VKETLTKIASEDKAAARRELRYQKLGITIYRWQIKLQKADRTMQRAVRMLAKLERQRLRMQKPPRPPKQANEARNAKIDHDIASCLEALTGVPETPADTMPPIPTFLQRKKDGEMRDKVAADAIRQEQADRKRAKSMARIETLKAKKSGAAKRMPLEGKAALAAISAAPQK